MKKSFINQDERENYDELITCFIERETCIIDIIDYPFNYKLIEINIPFRLYFIVDLKNINRIIHTLKTPNKIIEILKNNKFVHITSQVLKDLLNYYGAINNQNFDRNDTTHIQSLLRTTQKENWLILSRIFVFPFKTLWKFNKIAIEDDLLWTRGFKVRRSFYQNADSGGVRILVKIKVDGPELTKEKFFNALLSNKIDDNIKKENNNYSRKRINKNIRKWRRISFRREIKIRKRKRKIGKVKNLESREFSNIFDNLVEENITYPSTQDSEKFENLNKNKDVSVKNEYKKKKKISTIKKKKKKYVISKKRRAKIGSKSKKKKSQKNWC